VMSNHR